MQYVNANQFLKNIAFICGRGREGEREVQEINGCVLEPNVQLLESASTTAAARQIFNRKLDFWS